MNRPRKHHESYKAYKRAEKNEEWEIKRRLKGKVIWRAADGTYVRRIHGPIGR